MVNWQQALVQKWHTLRFGAVRVVSNLEKHEFQVEVDFGSLDPSDVRVELYANGVNSGEPERLEMMRGQPLTGENGCLYSVQVPAGRPAADYTARVIPQHDGAAIPLEAAHILWQR